ncbi:hypothetical protein BCR39DRAFT_552141 [Naematelia encephala]|uniref:Uncharacterized protein n=1 Tax=Naematelia encephala TaxID=71784 RepID=A0A1Y2AHQ3_9TREE|nr:hypothetical protein BCR39DRAFT_552141 [Naematelia encephala]
MSKPNPRLSKGLVRTLAQAPSSASSTHSALQLAPVVSQHSYSTSSSSSSSSTTSSVSNGKYTSLSSSFSTAASNRLSAALSSLSLSPSSSVSLLPTWDSAPFASLGLPDGYITRTGDGVVLPYRSTSRSKRLLSRRTGSSPREYTTATAPVRHQANFDSFGHPTSTSAQTLFFDKSSFPLFGSNSGTLHDLSQPSDLISSPTPPPEKPARHYLLSPYTSNDSPTSFSIALNPYLAYPQVDPSPIPPPPTSTDATSLNLYSSNLVFHLGASGLAKDRPPSPRNPPSARTPAPPPRARSFPLPKVTPPTTLRSTGVGEDAYFTRMDGMCIADGVGGWARSGRGDADAGRWSRLLTHFCEVEVGSWWAGDPAYLVNGGADATSDAPKSDKADDRGPSGWARKVWQRGAKESDEGRKRRPLDPVEIMQRGFEKCLSCVTAEVSSPG